MPKGQSRVGHDGHLLSAAVFFVFAVPEMGNLDNTEKIKKQEALCKAFPAGEAALETLMSELCRGTSVTSEKHQSKH